MFTVGLAWDLVHLPGVLTQPGEIPKTKIFNPGLAATFAGEQGPSEEWISYYDRLASVYSPGGNDGKTAGTTRKNKKSDS
jgi:hypothetical protein